MAIPNSKYTDVAGAGFNLDTLALNKSRLLKLGIYCDGDIDGFQTELARGTARKRKRKGRGRKKRGGRRRGNLKFWGPRAVFRFFTLFALIAASEEGREKERRKKGKKRKRREKKKEKRERRGREEGGRGEKKRRGCMR